MSTDAQLADTMTAAFRTVCRSIGATKTSPCVKEIVTTKIVELEKYGIAPTSSPAVSLKTSSF